MTRDVEERLSIFSEEDINIRRLALNFDQVNNWNPPENPEKETDSRYENYRGKFGEASWELDAVEPKNMVELLENEILSLVDSDIWDETVKFETAQTEKLMDIARNWK
jgi:hypothetical protein